MFESIDKVICELQEFKDDLEDGIAERRKKFSYELHEKRVIFERSVIEQHRKLKSSIRAYIKAARISSVLSAPFVYAMIVPFVFLDISVNIYQAICFRLWKLPRLDRSKYVVIDRHHLAYLNGLEKLNCIYCGYANGVVAFARDVAGRSEEFWCPIKHARRAESPHRDYYNFIEFGDAEGWDKFTEFSKRNKD